MSIIAPLLLPSLKTHTITSSSVVPAASVCGHILWEWGQTSLLDWPLKAYILFIYLSQHTNNTGEREACVWCHNQIRKWLCCELGKLVNQAGIKSLNFTRLLTQFWVSLHSHATPHQHSIVLLYCWCYYGPAMHCSPYTPHIFLQSGLSPRNKIRFNLFEPSRVLGLRYWGVPKASCCGAGATPFSFGLLSSVDPSIQPSQRTPCAECPFLLLVRQRK